MYLFDEQWGAPVNLGNDLMNHDARLVDLAAEPRLLCPADGISTIELLHHIVTRCAKNQPELLCLLREEPDEG